MISTQKNTNNNLFIFLGIKYSLMNRKIRGQNGQENEQPRRPVGSFAKSGGQDTEVTRPRLTLSRVKLIGAVMHKPGEKNGAGIVRYLCDQGAFDFMDVGNIYRNLGVLCKSGLLTKDDTGQYALTESGKQVCPDEKQYRKLLEASVTIRQVLKGIE
jgi:DNA-binding PadR family transcriptional regulator